MHKIQKIVSIIVLMILISTTVVLAANYTFTLTVKPETTNAKPGDTVSVDIGIADIDQTTQGINAIQGDIIFDENLFESVDLIGAGNNWSVSYNNTEGSELKGRFVLSNMNSVKDSQVVARLVAKIKNNATVKTGTITLKDVYSSYGSKETDKQTKTITVNISSSGEENNNTIIDDGSNNTITPASSTPSKTDTTKATQSTTTSTKSVLPKAGIVSWIGIVIVAIIIVAIIELIKYRRLTK